MKRIFLIILVILVLVLNLFTGCNTVDKSKFNILNDTLIKLDDNIKVFDVLSSDEVVYKNTINDSIIKNGIDNILCTYNLKTGEEKVFLKTINEKYMFNNVYIINNQWIIWIESDVKTDEIFVTTGGNYIIGCKNLQTNESFIIHEMNDTTSLQPIINVNPLEIYTDQHIIAYKIMEVSNGKYIEKLETFNLISKEKKIQHKTTDFFEKRISNIALNKEKIAFCEYPYDAKKNFLSKLYFYNINEEKRLLKTEKDETLVMQDPYFIDNELLLLSYELDDLSTSVFSTVNTENGSITKIFKENELSGNEIGTFPIIKGFKDGKIILDTLTDVKFYDLKNNKEILKDHNIQDIKILGEYMYILKHENGYTTQYLTK